MDTIKHTWRQVSDTWKGAACVLAGVIALVLLSCWVGSTQRRYPKNIVHRAKQLIKDSARWAAVSQQDQNPMLALVHATYAMAYINLARETFSDKELIQLSGTDTEELHAFIVRCQETAAKSVGTACPNLQISGLFGLYSGWLS